MATISSMGLSGLPLDDLLNNLRTHETQSLTLIQSRADRAQSRLSAYGQLQSALSAFQSATQAAAASENFQALTIQADSQAFTATASHSATPGLYDVQVLQLASAQRVAAPGRVERDASLGTGGQIQLSFANGKTHTITLDSSHALTLDALAAAFNADPHAGTSATVINRGGNAPYQLQLSARQTGTESALTSLTILDNETLASWLSFDAQNPAEGFIVQHAQNAQLQINGIDVSSQSNLLEDVLDGLTLELKGTNTSAESLRINHDDAAAKKAVQSFVNGYNNLLSAMRTLSAYDTEKQQAQPLSGDSLTRSVQTQMRSALNNPLGSNQISLADIGVTTHPSTGELLINDKTLTQALKDNKPRIEALFTAPDGLAARTRTVAQKLAGDNGIIHQTTATLDRQIAAIQDQYQQARTRIDQRMETYRLQFIALDRMVTEMNGLSTYLAQQLDMLGKIQAPGK